MKTSALLVSLSIAVLGACSSPMRPSGGEGSISLFFGQAATGQTARIAVNLETEDITHTITLTSSGGAVVGPIVVPPNSPPIRVAVMPDSWTVNVRAEGDRPLEYDSPSGYDPLFPSPMLRALGFSDGPIEVTAGENSSARIYMVSAAEVTNSAQLAKAIELASQLGGRDKIIVIMNDITTDSPFLIDEGANISFVSTTNVTIGWAEGFDGAIFNTEDGGGHPIFGRPGFTGSITLADSILNPLSVSITVNYGMLGDTPRTAITPLPDERSATVTVEVSGFTSDVAAWGVELDIEPIPGLILSGDNVPHTVDERVAIFYVTVTYDVAADGAAVAFGINPEFRITRLGGLEGLSPRYLEPAEIYTPIIAIHDGQADTSARAIPVNAANIQAFNTFAKGAGLARHYLLTQNVTLPAMANNWTAIGSDHVPFTGTFDGNHYTIFGLSISMETPFQGMFGAIGADAEIRNINLKNVNITAEDNVGGLVGRNRGTVRNSSASGDIIGGEFVGGLVGENHGTVEYSFATGYVTGHARVGGLVGWVRPGGEVRKSFATAHVTGRDAGIAIGGLIGEINGGSVENIFATGNVRGVRSVGGLVGTVSYVTGFSSNLSFGFATGNVTGESGFAGAVGIAQAAPGSNSVITHIVALNPLIMRPPTGETTINSHRVIGYSTFNGHTLSGLRARGDIVAAGFVFPGGNFPNERSGEAVPVGSQLSAFFVGWGATIWNIPDGNLGAGSRLPSLRGMPPAAAAHQNRTLPRAAATSESNPILVPGDTLAEQLAWLRQWARNNRYHLVEVRGDQSITSTEAVLPSGSGVGGGDRYGSIIIVRGVAGTPTITLSVSGVLFDVRYDHTLILENVTLHGYSANTDPLVRVDVGSVGTAGTLIMRADAVLTGNNRGTGSGSDGGAVEVLNGEFIMDGGYIRGNIGSNGGGVFVAAGGTFTMDGGTITTNEAVDGGGVHVATNGRFIMSDGTISNNTATGDGGGVFIQSNAGTPFTMTGGVIYGQNAADANSAVGSGQALSFPGRDDDNTFSTFDP